MKKITVLLLMLVFVAKAWAQKDKATDGLVDGYFTISSGLGVPIGDFGSSSPTRPNAYAAKTGANFEMNYSVRFSKFFGLAVMARSVSVAHSVTSPAGYFNGNDTNYLWTAEATPNKIKTAMMGLYFAAPLTKTKNVTLFFKPMMGASFVSEGTTSYSLIAKEPGHMNGTINVSTNGQSYAFAYSFALGLRYNISPLFAFMMQVDYMTSNPFFNAQAVVATTYRTYYQDVTPYYLRVQMLSFNLGLALKVN